MGGSGPYLYAETSSPRAQGDLFTLAYDGSACSDIDMGVNTVAFHYHMYGLTMGELRVTNAAGEVLRVTNATGEAVMRLSGDQGDSWQAATVDVFSPSFAFEYTRGSSYTGDAAVAQVAVSCGAAPPPPPRAPPTPLPPPTSPPPPLPPPSRPSFIFDSTALLKAAAREFDTSATSAIATYGPIAGWSVSFISDMSGLFSGFRHFDVDISSWDTSGVTDMSYMFSVSSNRRTSIWIRLARFLITPRPAI